LHGHPEGLEFHPVEAAAGAPVHAPAREHVEQRHLLGEPQRVVERGQRHREPDAQRARARGHVAPHDVDRRAHAVGVEVVLGEPHAVVPRLLHDLDARERARIDLGERDAPRPREELEHADLHAVSPPGPRATRESITRLALRYAAEPWPPTSSSTARIREAGSGSPSSSGCGPPATSSMPPPSTAARSGSTRCGPGSPSPPPPSRSPSPPPPSISPTSS